MKILAVVEQRDGTLRGVSREVVSAAAGIASETGGTVDALVIGGPGTAGIAGVLAGHGADRLLVAEHAALEGYHPDGYAQLVRDVAREHGHDVVLFPATSQGKDLAPRVAAHLDVPLAQDVTGFEAGAEGIAFVRPVYAGKAFTRITIEASPVLATLRPNVFQPEDRSAAGESISVPVSIDPATWPTKVVAFEAAGGDIPDVAEASIVVSGGRGLKDPEHWNVLEDLRAALGSQAGLGASRAVVDAGWRPHGEQVGQTGKTVAPRLYFAIGISGAIQHLAGMRTAGTIVAVNRDADAPIFKVADYGIVGDLFEVVPRLAEEIRTLRAEG